MTMRLHERWREQRKIDATDPEFWAEELANDIAIRVAKLLAEQGVSRTDLAQKLEVSKPYISQLLNGFSNMTLVTLSRLAWAVGRKPVVGFAPIRAVPAAMSAPAVADTLSTFADWLRDATVVQARTQPVAYLLMESDFADWRDANATEVRSLSTRIRRIERGGSHEAHGDTEATTSGGVPVRDWQNEGVPQS